MRLDQKSIINLLVDLNTKLRQIIETISVEYLSAKGVFKEYWLFNEVSTIITSSLSTHK